MKFLMRLFYVSVAGLFVLTSCAKEESESFDKHEDIALRAWMEKYHGDLLENYQEYGGYYVDIIELGDMDADAKPVNDTLCWVKYDFTGRDLKGNIILSRDEAKAKLAGTFTKYTHYVPYYRYCGEYSNMPVEGTHLAMRKTLTLGKDYADKLGLEKPEFLLREGSVVDLYLPSRVVGGGLEGQGGYEGQVSLSDKKPLAVRISVQKTVKNPLEEEGTEVDDFAKQGGDLKIFDTKDNKRPEKLDDPFHPYNMKEEWTNVCDTVPQVYVNFRFQPDKTVKFPQQSVYKSAYLPYSNFSKLEKDISDALVKRFHTDDPYKGVLSLADSVGLEGTAKIWYICRFLDGFIADTNIKEVKELIYDAKNAKGSVMSYTAKDKKGIQAFYYTIPNLRYGQWAAMITTSTNAYGSAGQAGSTETSGGSGYGTGYSDYMNSYNYYNSYYGSMGGYGGYYDGYYGNYNNGYYGNYGYGSLGSSGNTGSSETKTTVSTEVPPFTPLLFEIYVEPKAEE